MGEETERRRDEVRMRQPFPTLSLRLFVSSSLFPYQNYPPVRRGTLRRMASAFEV